MEEFRAWMVDTWNATGPFRLFLWEQREWLFSGIGATAVTGGVAVVTRRKREPQISNDINHIGEMIERLVDRTKNDPTATPALMQRLLDIRTTDPALFQLRLQQLLDDTPTENSVEQSVPFSALSKPAPPKLELKKPTEAERLAFDKQYLELMKKVPLQRDGDEKLMLCLLSTSVLDPPASSAPPPSRSRVGVPILMIGLFIGSFLAIRLAASAIERLFL